MATRPAIAAAMIWMGAAVAAPAAPGSEDAELMAPFADWIKSQHLESGAWCCDASDGRPLFEGEWRTVGAEYEVFISRRHWPDAPEAGFWLRVPPYKVTGSSPLGLAVAWWTQQGGLYCFAPVGGF